MDSIVYEILSENQLESFMNNFSDQVVRWQALSTQFLKTHFDNINWICAAQFQNLEPMFEDLNKQFPPSLNQNLTLWNTYITFQRISEKHLRRIVSQNEQIDWRQLCKKTLSCEFINDYFSFLPARDLIEFQTLSHDMIRRLWTNTQLRDHIIKNQDFPLDLVPDYSWQNQPHVYLTGFEPDDAYWRLMKTSDKKINMFRFLNAPGHVVELYYKRLGNDYCDEDWWSGVSRYAGPFSESFFVKYRTKLSWSVLSSSEKRIPKSILYRYNRLINWNAYFFTHQNNLDFEICDRFFHRRSLQSFFSLGKNLHKYILATATNSDPPPPPPHFKPTISRTLYDFALENILPEIEMDDIKVSINNVRDLVIQKDILVFQLVKRFFLNDDQFIETILRFSVCSERFIEELLKHRTLPDYLWTWLVKCQSLSEEFIDKWSHKMIWAEVERFQILSKSTISKRLLWYVGDSGHFCDGVNNLIVYQKIPSDMLDFYALKGYFNAHQTAHLVMFQKLSNHHIASLTRTKSLLPDLFAYQTLNETHLKDILFSKNFRAAFPYYVYFQFFSSDLLDRLIEHDKFNLSTYVCTTLLPNTEWICTNWNKHFVQSPQLMRDAIINIQFEENFIEMHRRTLFEFAEELSRHQQLSCTFIKKWYRHLNIMAIFANQAVDFDLIETLYDPIGHVHGLCANKVVAIAVKAHAQSKFKNLKWPRRH